MKLQKLTSKFALFISVLIIAIFGSTVSIFYFSTQSNIREDIHDEFLSSEMMFTKFMDMRSMRLFENAELISKDFGFRGAVATQDISTIESAIQNLRARMGFSWYTVITQDAGVLVDREPGFAKAAMAELGQDANHDEPISGISVIDGEAKLIISVPIFAPDFIGCAIFGFKISAPELRSLVEFSSFPYHAGLLFSTGEENWSHFPLTTVSPMEQSFIQQITKLVSPSQDNHITGKLRVDGNEEVVRISKLPGVLGKKSAYLVFHVNMDEALARYSNLFFSIFLMGFIGVTLAISGSIILARSITHPISVLAQAAHAFGRGERPKIDLKKRRDEIGDLAINFQNMAEEIADRTDELRNVNATLESRIEERSADLKTTNERLTEEVEQRRSSEEALSVAKQKAEEANLAKDEFLATMSHELRTPMNGILGIAQYLKTQPGIETFRDKIDILESSSNALLAILNDILDFAKIESGRIEIEETPFRVSELAENIQELWSASIKNKGLDFVIYNDFDKDEEILGDIARVMQIANNYLNNAVKFTVKGAIFVYLEKIDAGGTAPQFKLSVKDTGAGIKPEEKKLLFKKFSQLERGKARNFGGTGLGLAICRKLAKAMGGDVGVESAPGLGAVFWAATPLRAVANTSAAHDEANLEPVSEVQSIPESPVIPDNDTVTPTPFSGSEPLKVFLVEDNDVNIQIISLFTEQLGHSITHQATDGDQAVKIVNENGIVWDVILMDLRMPTMDGITATKLIRENGFTTDQIPIIALTADAMASDRDACFEAGMTDFLSKPVSIDALEKAFNRVRQGTSQAA